MFQSPERAKQERANLMAQSLAAIVVHLVFSTKFRQPLIKPEVEANFHAYLSGIFRDCKCPTLLIGGMPDHIHALFLLHRTWALADLVEEVKKSSSKWMKTNGKEYQHFHWQGGYGAFSVSQSAAQEVKAYIANQKSHHRKMTFQDEFRALLKKYEVEYDERYVWD
jgi:REP element-mobilizing transposase RayT